MPVSNLDEVWAETVYVRELRHRPRPTTINPDDQDKPRKEISQKVRCSQIHICVNRYKGRAEAL